MKTSFIETGDTNYECPHCRTEHEDFTGDEIESGPTYCGYCNEEFYIEVAE